MSDVLRLETDRADLLVSLYESRAIAIDLDAATVSRTIAAADGLLTGGEAADGQTAVRRLQALATTLRHDADDLAWRVAYVRARAASGLPIGAIVRDLRLESMPVSAVVVEAMEDGSAAALQELAIRAALDDETAAVIARLLGPSGIEALQQHTTERAEDFFAELGHDLVIPPKGMTTEEQLVRVRSDFDRVVADLGALLGALSHTREGRDAIITSWEESRSGRDVGFALLHGRWDADFLLPLAEAVFSDSELRWRLDDVIYPWMVSPALLPEIHPVRSVVLDAIARNPDAAHEFIVERHGYALVTDPDTGWAAHQRPDATYDSIMADLLRAAMFDPRHVDEVAQVLTVGPDGGVPLFETIVDHDLPGSMTAEVWAEIISTQWPAMAGADPAVYASRQDTGRALAALFAESEAAMEQIIGSFSVFVGATYTEGFIADDVERARRLSSNGFGLLDEAFDTLQDTDDGDDHLMLVRRAFTSLLGQGPKYVAGALRLGGPPGWAFGLVAGEVIDALGDGVFPSPPASIYPDSKEVLDSLFLPGESPAGTPGEQPAPLDVMITEAAFAAFPAEAARLEAATPFVADGTLQIPEGGAALADFNKWVRDVLKTDAFFSDKLGDELIDLGTEANLYTG